MMGTMTNKSRPARGRITEDWEVTSALETLQRAESIRKDKPLMQKVRALAKEKLIEMASVAGEGVSTD